MTTIDPIPYFINQYAVFADTLPQDDTTESLVLRPPTGTPITFAYADLTRTVNPDGTITYSRTVKLTQPGAWNGEFLATGGAANRAPVYAYVVDL
jgi:hypothetical protein